ncbi:MAG: hypothetical protein KKH88_02125 [Nanoarchaeota archaeon]|nr:hypothetical protein [Nanoarchaeota archaeon]
MPNKKPLYKKPFGKGLLVFIGIIVVLIILISFLPKGERSELSTYEKLKPLEGEETIPIIEEEGALEEKESSLTSEEALIIVLDECAKNPYYKGKSREEICWNVDGRLCNDKYSVEENSFGGGYVVYDNSAVWVVRENKKVFAINGLAMTLAPHLDTLYGEESDKLFDRYLS